jgi:hypothetical protein
LRLEGSWRSAALKNAANEPPREATTTIAQHSRPTSTIRPAVGGGAARAAALIAELL